MPTTRHCYFLPGASATIRAQVAALLATTSRHKLTAGQFQMPHFAPRTDSMGRPCDERVTHYAAVMLSTFKGISEKRAIELLQDDPSVAPAALWKVAGLALQDGCATTDAFRGWFSRHVQDLC